MNCNTPIDIVFSFEEFRLCGRPTDRHDDKPCANSPMAEFVVKTYQIKSTNVIAHIRKATQGSVGLANTHPFIREILGKYWLFAHNGHLGGFQPKEGKYYRPIGSTDSERVFCFILTGATAQPF
ncbi:class II glutamine amidotransferase [Eikenella exigua]|uniref:class II glutamine amidotransferase n=1 Tax=Eikenella exigua TaxID=2528037 RepID=UPI0007DF73AA|nr:MULTISPECIES: class II glutamine amidotransferase [Eikenella]OAM25695.1 hypothetical protein A7P94_09195 [Eikenella sp. NML01-A-086]OAM42585.1 hypothetical protein A7Q02_02045 [Eikenella sp. NML97-A-109]